jgi:hypothetical protein
MVRSIEAALEPVSYTAGAMLRRNTLLATNRASTVRIPADGVVIDLALGRCGGGTKTVTGRQTPMIRQLRR